MDREEATKFFNDWLWDSEYNERLTEGMPWHYEYIEDVVSMLVDATKTEEEV